MGWKAQVNGVQVMLTWNGMAAPIFFAPNHEAATALADAINRASAGVNDDTPGSPAILQTRDGAAHLTVLMPMRV
jgi:hypothetical protein